jgi:DNA-binding NtrC family response regulator
MATEPLTILAIGGEARWARRLGFYLERSGARLATVSKIDEAADRLAGEAADFVLLCLPDVKRLHAARLRELTEAMDGATIVALLDEPGESTEHLLREAGLSEALPLALPARQLARILERYGQVRRLEEETRHLRQVLECRTSFEELIGGAAPMRAMYRLIEQVSRADAPVLVCGERGSEFLQAARSIRRRGSRAGQPMVRIECRADDPDRVELALFGPVGGDAHAEGPTPDGSAFARAGQGTLLLENVEALSTSAQRRLLHFLRSPFFQGETSASAHPVARLIATTSADLKRLVEEGKFNRDLYYRLSVLQVRIPPINERKEDIPLLAEHVLQSLQADDPARRTRPAASFSSEALLQLFQYDWPGNFEELASTVREAVGQSAALRIEPRDLPERLVESRAEAEAARPSYSANSPLRQAKQEFEAAYFNSLLELTRGNMTLASRISKVGRPYLYKKLKEYEIDPNDFR